MDKKLLREMGDDWLRPGRWLPLTLAGISVFPCLVILLLLCVSLGTGDFGRDDLRPAILAVLGSGTAIAAFPLAFWLAERQSRRRMVRWFACLTPAQRAQFRREAEQFAASGGFYCGTYGLWVRHNTHRHPLSLPFRRTGVIPYNDIVWAYGEYHWTDTPPATSQEAVGSLAGSGVVFYTRDGARHKFTLSRESPPVDQLIETLRPHIPHAVTGYSGDRGRLFRQDPELFARHGRSL